MRVPAKMTLHAGLLWGLAALVATGLAFWDILQSSPQTPRREAAAGTEAQTETPEGPEGLSGEELEIDVVYEATE